MRINEKPIYSFLDVDKVSEKQNKTILQVVLEFEKSIEDPRAKGFVDQSIRQFSDSLFTDGAEGQFPLNGFTALDLNIRRPIENTFALRDVPQLYGGGALETDRGFLENFATNTGRLASGNNNKVNLVDANTEAIQVPIEPIQLGLAVGQIDLMKSDHIGYDIIGQKHKAVRASYNIELDLFNMVGHKGIDGTATVLPTTPRGLLNQTSTYAENVNLTTKLESMDTVALTGVFVNNYIKHLERFAYQPSFAPTKILVYPSLYATLVKPANINNQGTVFRSQLEYIEAQLAVTARTFGAETPRIVMLPYLEANTIFNPLLTEAGTNGTGKIVMYRQDPYILRTRLALDLTPGALVFDPANNQFRRNYVAFIGVPLVFYQKAITYINNAA